ncbi:MAG TPA: tetratricopeptide repeat protein [Candidatus Hydrogenedentes bacterium]|nr:tetratricopeptide repeat protein [Candidatus Hydrogenedentota bacterium]
MANRADHSDLSDLAEYVVVHPEDYDRRWTLAKKLYMAWEYTEALKHLQILKKNWSRRLNVLRYLAATYYRLGRYDEAITELREITTMWPDEIAVWEQLARVYEVTEKRAEAAKAWEKIVALNPSHSLAARSVQRLRSKTSDSVRDDLRLRDSDSGIDLSPYRICSNCGAQNSDEFERCWQCHARLNSGEPSSDIPSPAVPLRSKRWPLTALGGLLTVAACSASIFLITRHLNQGAWTDVDVTHETVYAVLSESLLIPRLATFLFLLVSWPLALMLAFRMFNSRKLSYGTAFGASLLLSSVTHLALWAPLKYSAYAILAPGVLSLVVVYILASDSVARVVGIWIVQGFLSIILGLAAFMLTAGSQPILQLPNIIRYQSSLSAIRTPGEYPLFSEKVGTARTVRWGSTGATWLDHAGRRMLIEIEPTEAGDPLQVRILSGGKVVGEASAPPYRIPIEVQINAVYEIFVTGPEDAYYLATAHGILRPQS